MCCWGQARLGYINASGLIYPKEFQNAVHPMASPWSAMISALVGLGLPRSTK